MADTLASDRFAPPPPLLESRYEFLGDEDIAFERYTSPEFFQREMSDLWPRAWQWACREEHLPDVGDTYVYDIGPYSVIVVRSAVDTIQAFLNSCTHRGTRILAGEGSGYSARVHLPVSTAGRGNSTVPSEIFPAAGIFPMCVDDKP